MNTGYVVCAKCGARIKADRDWCLRCEAPLVAKRSPDLPLPGWLQALGGGTLIFAIVGVLVMVLIGFTVWEARSTAIDTVGHPAPPPASAGEDQKVIAENTTPARSVSLFSATFLDATRNGRAELSDSDLAAARARYEQALAKTPDDPEALNNLGLTVQRLGQGDDAIKRFSRAAQLVPKNWAYHLNLAHALSEKQDWDHAVSEYRVAAGLFPTDSATQFNLAMTLQAKGDAPGAMAALEKAVKLAPSDPASHLALATSLEKAGRTADARPEYQRYLDLAPSAPDADAVRTHLR
jgi:Flp pilus assembly protein TadD